MKLIDENGLKIFWKNIKEYHDMDLNNKLGDKLDTIISNLDTSISNDNNNHTATNTKLDTANTKLDDTETKLNAILAKLDNLNTGGGSSGGSDDAAIIFPATAPYVFTNDSTANWQSEKVYSYIATALQPFFNDYIVLLSGDYDINPYVSIRTLYISNNNEGPDLSGIEIDPLEFDEENCNEVQLDEYTDVELIKNQLTKVNDNIYIRVIASEYFGAFPVYNIILIKKTYFFKHALLQDPGWNNFNSSLVSGVEGYLSDNGMITILVIGSFENYYSAICLNRGGFGNVFMYDYIESTDPIKHTQYTMHIQSIDAKYGIYMLNRSEKTYI